MWTVDARRRYAWTRRKEGLRLIDQEWAIGFCECGVDQPFTLRARNSRARRSESSAAFSLYEGAMWSGSAKL